MNKRRQGELFKRLRERRLDELSVFNAGDKFGSSPYRRVFGASSRQIANRGDLEDDSDVYTSEPGVEVTQHQNRLTAAKRPMTTSVQPFRPQRQRRQPMPRSETMSAEGELKPDEWRALYARLLSRIERRNDRCASAPLFSHLFSYSTLTLTLTLSFYMLSMSPRNDYLFLPPLSSQSHDARAHEWNASSPLGNITGLNFSGGSVNWSWPSARPRLTLLVPTLLILGMNLNTCWCSLLFIFSQRFLVALHDAQTARLASRARASPTSATATPPPPKSYRFRLCRWMWKCSTCACCTSPRATRAHLTRRQLAPTPTPRGSAPPTCATRGVASLTRMPSLRWSAPSFRTLRLPRNRSRLLNSPLSISLHLPHSVYSIIPISSFVS